MSTNFIITIISAILGSGIISTIISHVLYTKKLKKEQSMKANYGSGVKTAKALLKLREILQDGNIIEIYDAETVMHQENFNATDHNTLYPAILSNKASLEQFISEVDQFRKEYENYLDCDIALRVVLIDRYLYQLMLFMKNYEDKFWPTFGTLFIIYVQKMLHSCDKRAIRKINMQKYKLEYHNGRKWKCLRPKLLEKPFNNTLLMRIKNNNLSDIEIAVIGEVIEEIKSKNHKQVEK